MMSLYGQKAVAFLMFLLLHILTILDLSYTAIYILFSVEKSLSYSLYSLLLDQSVEYLVRQVPLEKGHIAFVR